MPSGFIDPKLGDFKDGVINDADITLTFSHLNPHPRAKRFGRRQLFGRLRPLQVHPLSLGRSEFACQKPFGCLIREVQIGSDIRRP